MDDVSISLIEFHAAEQARRQTAEWLASFETALLSRDAAQIGALFHEDCHWRDNAPSPLASCIVDVSTERMNPSVGVRSLIAGAPVGGALAVMVTSEKRIRSMLRKVSTPSANVPRA